MDFLDTVITVIGLSSLSSHQIGRTAIQKLVYFASQKGIVEDEDTYFPHYYGPYSRETARALSTAVSIDFIQERAKDFPEYEGKGRKYVYTLTNSGQELYSMIEKRQTKDRRKLGEIVSICERTAGLNMQIMACAAKVHYIITQEKRMMTPDEIKRTARNLRWDLKENDIDRATKLLIELGLEEVGAERLDLRDLRNAGNDTWSRENVQTYIDRERNEWER